MDKSKAIQQQATDTLDERLRLPKILQSTGYSRATLYRRIAEGQFPKGIKDGRITVWSGRAVRDWQQAHA